MNELPIPTQAGQVQTNNVRSQILNALTRQTQKAAVVGNQCLALQLQRGRPANPANPVVPACHLEGRRGPASQ